MWNVKPNQELYDEFQVVKAYVGNPELVFVSNVKYLLEKYQPSRADLKSVFKHIKVSPQTLNALVNGRLNAFSTLYVSVLVYFFNTKYSAGLSFGEMFVDLRQRDLLNKF